MATAAPPEALQLPVWLLLERKTTFSAAQWRAAHARFSRARVLPPPARPQVLLALAFLDDREPPAVELLVARAHAAPTGDRDAVEGRTRLPLEVRAMEDVRTAQRFLTSAPSQMLDLFLAARDAEAVRAFLSARPGADTPCASVGAPEAYGAAPADSPSALLNGAFAALERAQQERADGRLARALALFREAERGFLAAERRLPDARSRELLRSRRRDLERAIADVEARVRGLHGSAATAAAERPPVDVLARLEALRSDAAAAGAVPAAPAPAPEELTARLAALRHGGKAPTGSADAGDLAARLRRLRGPSAVEASSAWAVDVQDLDEDEDEQAARVLRQAADELELGMSEGDEGDEGDESSKRRQV